MRTMTGAVWKVDRPGSSTLSFSTRAWRTINACVTHTAKPLSRPSVQHRGIVCGAYSERGARGGRYRRQRERMVQGVLAHTQVR
jgi:hypothetical protein